MAESTTVVCGEEITSMPNCEQYRATEVVAVDNPFGSF
jgi:hypothetical protein